MLCKLILIAVLGVNKLHTGYSTLPHIALATIGIKVPEVNTTNFDALQLGGAGLDLGLKFIIQRYNNTFNFSHTYLVKEGRGTVTLLEDDVSEMAGKFIFQHEGRVAGMALLSPCSQENNHILLMTRESRVLLGCSAGTSKFGKPGEPANPQQFSLSLYSGTVILDFIYALLTRNGWTNVAALVDLRSIAAEYMCRGIHRLLQQNFNAINPSMEYIRYNVVSFDSGASQTELKRTLQTTSQTNRIVFIFGSGKAIMLILRTAKKLGMTNGEYVFFMLTFSRHGFSLDNQDDSWWKVTDTNVDLSFPLRGYVSPAAVVISLRTPYVMTPFLAQLRQDIIQNALRNYNFTYAKNEVPTFVYAGYDMCLIYGQLLNETYNRTGRIPDGIELGNLIRNQTFFLPTGTISFSVNGEREVEVIGEIVNPQTGNYTESLLYQPPSRSLINTSDIAAFWPGGHWPPPNEPHCGYLNNRCDVTRLDSKATLGVCLAVLLLFIVAFGSIFYTSRRYRSHWWLLTDDPLMPGQLRGYVSPVAVVISLRSPCVMTPFLAKP
ncbi:hypothetical protein BV898_14964 [Hypsibius exemplaris]|uniref:Receptor ligand binding region domain-containing protein n=1 Tax=Hypsibius exemplaris TaxID=2072580 RepID=A0A9X6RJZ3_HYPEX|nr:hypothetical protein BV898_14964 [Hypsibius exemplaris]